MGLLYIGEAIVQYVVDRAAVDMPLDVIRLQIARDFDGWELSEATYKQILLENVELLDKRRAEIRAKIEAQNPVSVVLESVERLREVSKNSTDAKEISTVLATLRGYLELLMKKLGSDVAVKEQKVYVQQNFFMSLEELERKKFIEIKDVQALKSFIGVESDGVAGPNGVVG